jgi:hypothetical protein
MMRRFAVAKQKLRRDAMADYMLMMHADAPAPEVGWDVYLSSLRQSGAFEGGSTVGSGACFRKYGPAPGISAQINGYIRVQAEDLAHAQRFLAGNPCFEAGGTVEIRELPQD